MPDKKDKFIGALKAGIGAIESGGQQNPYSSSAGDKNKDGKPDSTALGKYQFLKTYWWDTKHPIPGIKQFAKGKEAVFGEINDWEDVKGNEGLQEAYFSYYAENHLLPEASKAIAKGNPLNLSVGQAAAVIHKNGYGAGSKVITSGKLGKETDTNASDMKYLDVFDKAIVQEGYSDISVNDYISYKKENDSFNKTDKKLEKRQKETVESFIEKDKRLTELSKEGIPQGEIEKARSKIFSEVKSLGLTEQFDEYVEQEREKVSTQKEFMKVLANSEAEMFDMEGEDNDDFSQIKGAWGDHEKMQNLKDSLPKSISKYVHVQKKNNDGRIVINRQKTHAGGGYENKSIEKFFGALNEENKKLFNDNYTPISGEKLKEGWFDGMTTGFVNFGRELEGDTPRVPGTLKTGDYSKAEGRPKIDWNQVQATPRKEPEKAETEPETKKGEVKKAEPETKKEDTKEEDLESKNFAQKSLNTELGLLDTGTGKTTPLESKRELPIDAITGMALGFIGNEQAENANIPLRTEEVSGAIKKFTSDLAKRSKEGLPAEVEAAMNNKLAEAYQGGLRSIVNASGGNRATVLGNQGQLEVAKNRGLVDIQLADFEAKEKAFQQYGEAIKYKNDFDARRDIANHGIKYQEGKRDQLNGEKLAEAGFSQLVEGIKYQRENGPGSANSLYEAHLFQKMFGFNPNAPDDGTGKPGTKSAFDMKQKELTKKKGITEAYQQKLSSLNPDQKKAADKFFLNNSDSEKRYEFIDYLQNNPDVDAKNIKMDNMDKATQEKNYGLLSMTREEANKPKMIESPSIDKTISDEVFAKPDNPLNASTDAQGLLATAPKPNSPEEIRKEEDKPNFAESYESRILQNMTNLA